MQRNCGVGQPLPSGRSYKMLIMRGRLRYRVLRIVKPTMLLGESGPLRNDYRYAEHLLDLMTLAIPYHQRIADAI